MSTGVGSSPGGGGGGRGPQLHPRGPEDDEHEQLARVGEREVPRGVRLRLGREARLELLLEQLLAALRLAHHLDGAVAEPRDEVLDLGDVALLRVVLALLVLVAHLRERASASSPTPPPSSASSSRTLRSATYAS